MTETKTEICEVLVSHFVATSRQPVVTYRKNARPAQPTALHTEYLVIASNSVFSNIVWNDRIHFCVILEWVKLKGG